MKELLIMNQKPGPVNQILYLFFCSITTISHDTFTQDTLMIKSLDTSIQSTTGIIKTSHANSIWYKKFFTDASANKTPILCLHGGPGFTHHCMLDLQAIATDYPVIFYDQSGCGNSKTEKDLEEQGHHENKWTFDYYLQELEEIIDALGYKKVILLGYSWGGTLALKYASLHQNKLAALILASPLVSTKQWVADCKTLAASISPEFLALIEKHEEAKTTNDGQYLEAVTLFYKNFLCRMEPYSKNVLDSCAAMNPIIYHTMWGPSEFTATGNLQNVDLTHELSKINIPTLITCGLYDMATPETMQKYADQLPNSTVAILHHSAHMNIAEEPEAYVNIVQDFLKSMR